MRRAAPGATLADLGLRTEEEKMGARFSAAAAAVAITGLAAGCGGSSKPDQTARFKSGFVPAVDQLRNISHGIGTEIEHASGQTDGQLATVFRGFAASWQGQLSKLQTLTPPANLATSFNTLTGAAGRVESDLTAVVSAAQTNSGSAAKQATASLVADILAAKSASTTITNKLGVK